MTFAVALQDKGRTLESGPSKAIGIHLNMSEPARTGVLKIRWQVFSFPAGFRAVKKNVVFSFCFYFACRCYSWLDASIKKAGLPSAKFVCGAAAAARRRAENYPRLGPTAATERRPHNNVVSISPLTLHALRMSSEAVVMSQPEPWHHFTSSLRGSLG